MPRRDLSIVKRIWRRCWASALAGALVAAFVSTPTHAVENKYWELSPYQIDIQVAVDDSARSQPSLDTYLVAYLEQRIFSTLHPLWSVSLEVPQAADRRLLLDSLPMLDEHITETKSRFDKRMFLTVVADAQGYLIACREWDQYTRLRGAVRQHRVTQEMMLPEQCFNLLRSTFAPVAKVRVDPDDEKRVQLLFKGSELPRRTDDVTFRVPGDVYRPLLARFDHKGEMRPNGLSKVPWTLLTLDEPEEGKWHCTLHSGMRRPFGLRRRGRSENLAIAVRNPPATTRVRFYARYDKSRGLSGYEVFRRLRDDAKTELIGLTDATGSIEVVPAESSIVTLFLRSDGLLLAKIPVAPGADPLVEVPIADDTARLLAQAELTALREQLIDIVARRNILMARIRNRLEENQLDEAKEMLSELDDLPGRARFNSLLSTAQRAPDNISQDPRVQKKIEGLFAQTRQLLGRFLGIRQISELRNEVNAAVRGNPE